MAGRHYPAQIHFHGDETRVGVFKEDVIEDRTVIGGEFRVVVVLAEMKARVLTFHAHIV